MGRATIKKGQGVVYEGLGWKRCSCGRVGYHYRWRGKIYVKHPAPAEQQLVFGEGAQLLQSQKQGHCAPLVRGRR